MEEIVAPPAEEAAGEEKRKLTSAEWAECRSLYELGEARTPELSERFGVTKQAISKHFKENKVEFGSRKKELEEKVAAVATAAAAKVSVAVASFESTRKAKIEETKIEAYSAARAIAHQTHKLVLEAARAGTAHALNTGEFKALRIAAAIIGQTRRDRYEILNAANDIDEESLPEIRIVDLSEAQIKRLRDTSGDEEDDLPDIDFDDDEENEVIETS